MAIRKFLVTTSVADARPVMFRGASVYSMYPQISSLLARRFGPAHAALLAEPLADPAKNTIDWYASISGQIRPWSELSPSAREDLKSRMATLAADISTHAEELKAARDPHQNNIGNFLALALNFPDERCFYVVDDQPVMVCWGFTPSQGTIEPHMLTRFAAATPAVVAEPESITRPGRQSAAVIALPPAIQPLPIMVSTGPSRSVPWMPILAFLAGLGIASLVAYLILFVLPPLSGSGASAMLAEEHQREVVLRGERARLLTSIAQTCKPNGSSNPVQGNARREIDPAVTQATGREMDERLRRAGAALTGDIVVSLEWKSTNDLDLRIIEPSGEVIYYNHKQSESGGTLDADANVSSLTTEPIENVVWPQGRAPAGTYKVLVSTAAIRDQSPDAFRYMIRVQNGRNIDFHSGSAQGGEILKVVEFKHE